MAWKDVGSAQVSRGLSDRNRVILDDAIRQADEATRTGRADGLDHGLLLNVRPDPIDFRDRFYQPGLIALAPRLNPPEELIRTPVRDQGFLGSCTGMALAAAIDVLQRRRVSLVTDIDRGAIPPNAQPDAPPDPPPVSARMLFEMGRVYDEHSDDGLGGSSLRGVIRGFFHNGVCREVDSLDSPDEVLPGEWQFTLKRAREASMVRLGAYARLQHVLLDYHSALNEIGIVLVSTFIHSGWERRRGGTLASQDDRRRWRIRWDGTQTPQGGHAVLIVGYDEHGFLVRNSWGDDWSRWQDRHPGVAHWSYDDWQRHVMDAWVIRLGVPGSHDARALGGRPAISGPRSGTTKTVARGSPPRILVNGHYLNIRDGLLASRPPYNCEMSSVRETAQLLRASQDYDHLAIAVESGLDDLDTMVERALALIPYLKQARVYPIFVWWRDGCFDQASEILEDRARRLEPKTGGLPELGAFMLESFAREFMQPFWRNFEGEVERAFMPSDKEKRGQGWRAIGELLSAARERERPLQVHAVAHSAGALWLAALCKRLADATDIPGSKGGVPLDGIFSSVSLLAPICHPGLYLDPNVSRLWASHGKALAIYTLSERQELEDRVGAYRGSFLRLAQRVFPIDGSIPDGVKPNSILGFEADAKKVVRRRHAREHAQWFAVGGRDVDSACRTHRGLSSDSAVLMHILERVNPGGFSEPPPLILT
jgi:hypothetical protein